MIHNMFGDYRVPLETRKRPKIMSKILWEELEVLSLRFQNPAARSECVSLGFSSACSRHSPRNISKRLPQVLVDHGDP